MQPTAVIPCERKREIDVCIIDESSHITAGAALIIGITDLGQRQRVSCTAMKSLLRFPRAPFAMMVGASLLLTVGAVLMTQFMHLAACPLCIIQRILDLVLAVAAIVGLALAGYPLGRRLGALMTAIVSGTGVFVAGYQSYLQRFSIDTGCSGRMTWWEELVDWAGGKVPLLFQSDGICSDPGWVFLGLSLAEWSLVFFTGFFALSLYTLLRRR